MAFKLWLKSFLKKFEKSEVQLSEIAFKNLCHFGAYKHLQHTRLGFHTACADFDSCKREYFRITGHLQEGSKREPLTELIKKLKVMNARGFR